MIEYDQLVKKYDSDPTCKNYDFSVARARIAELEAIATERDEAERRALAFIAPGGYDEHIATRVLTDPILHAFAFVADREYKRAEQNEVARDKTASSEKINI